MSEQKAIRVYEVELTEKQREGLTVGHAIPGSGGVTGPEATDDRWCPHCGGELAIKRQMRENAITTYLLCYFCHWKRPTLRYDYLTRVHEDLLVLT